MNLYINRKQTAGMLGGIQFELGMRAELTPEEIEIVRKYKLEKRPIISDYSIGDLVSGRTFKSDEVNDVLEREMNVKKYCGSFKTYLDELKNFGGQEVYEYREKKEDQDGDVQ